MGEARECLRGTLDSRPVRRAIKRVQQLCASDPVPVKKFRNRNRAQVAMAAQQQRRAFPSRKAPKQVVSENQRDQAGHMAAAAMAGHPYAATQEPQEAQRENIET